MERECDLARLGDEIKRRRLSLGRRMTQRRAAELAEISDTTWNQLENGRGPQPSEATKGGICRALRWTPDSIDRICEGVEPLVLDAVGTEVGPDRLELLRRKVASHDAALTRIEEDLKRVADAVGVRVVGEEDEGRP